MAVRGTCISARAFGCLPTSVVGTVVKIARSISIAAGPPVVHIAVHIWKNNRLAHNGRVCCHWRFRRRCRLCCYIPRREKENQIKINEIDFFVLPLSLSLFFFFFFFYGEVEEIRDRRFQWTFTGGWASKFWGFVTSVGALRNAVARVVYCDAFARCTALELIAAA